MKFSSQKLTIEQAREADIVDYLSRLGHTPSKIRQDDYWYLSPLRWEKTPSFKVNRKLNRWYDHGLGKGGNIIDFAILYNNCTVGEFLKNLYPDSSFHKPQTFLKQHPDNPAKERRINILETKKISSIFLLRYLRQRRIPIAIAEAFCREITYELNGKQYYAIGFQNDSGGYEIRNPYFKGSSSPKGVTTIKNGSEEVFVFEGFMNFLSFLVIHKNQLESQGDFLILNSVSFFEKARPFLEQYEQVRLYLDRDATGQNCSRYALSLSARYKDESGLYHCHNDLNDWLVNFGRG